MSQQQSLESAFSVLKRRRDVWLFPLLSVIFILISFSVLLIPQLQGFIEAKEELEEAEIELQRLQSKTSLLEQLSEPQLDKQLTTLEAVLPSRKPVLELLALLDAYALEQEVQLQSYEFNPGRLASESATEAPESESSRDGIQQLEIELQIEGSFDEIQAFFEQIESMGPLSQLDIVEQNLLTNQIVADELRQQATVTLQVQFLPPPENLGKLETTVKALSPEEIELIKQLSDYSSVNDLNIGFDLPDSIPSRQRPNPFGF